MISHFLLTPINPKQQLHHTTKNDDETNKTTVQWSLMQTTLAFANHVSHDVGPND